MSVDERFIQSVERFTYFVQRCRKLKLLPPESPRDRSGEFICDIASSIEALMRAECPKEEAQTK